MQGFLQFTGLQFRMKLFYNGLIWLRIHKHSLLTYLLKIGLYFTLERVRCFSHVFSASGRETMGGVFGQARMVEWIHSV